MTPVHEVILWRSGTRSKFIHGTRKVAVRSLYLQHVVHTGPDIPGCRLTAVLQVTRYCQEHLQYPHQAVGSPQVLCPVVLVHQWTRRPGADTVLLATPDHHVTHAVDLGEGEAVHTLAAQPHIPGQVTSSTNKHLDIGD